MTGQELQAFENGREYGAWVTKEEANKELGKKLKYAYMNGYEEGCRDMARDKADGKAHWQLFLHESYAEIGCSRCGFVPWRCTTLYPEYGSMAKRQLDTIKKDKLYCEKCGAKMEDEVCS